MTRKQILKKCEIAKNCGEAILSSGDVIRYFDTTGEYSLLSAWKHQTILVTYKPEKIADICID